MMAAVLAGATMAGAGSPANAQQATVPEADAVQINAALKGMTEAWNHHDMKAFVSYMTEDVEWVNVVGMWWRGKAQVYQAHEAFHQTIFKNRELHPPQREELRRLSADTVLVTSVTPSDGFTTPSGQVNPPGRDVLTQIFVHRDGRWLVAAGHNTTIVEEAQASNPVKDSK